MIKKIIINQDIEKPKKQIKKKETKDDPKLFCTTKYAQDLVDGKIVACKAEIQLAKKHLADIKKMKSKNYPYFFDESRAIRFFRFFESCIDPDTGVNYKLLPHQMFDEGLIYGWVDKNTGHLRYKKVYKQVAKGQAKTTTSSIKAMYELVAHKIYKPDNQNIGYITPNKIIHLMAVDKIQANELREPIVAICKSTPYLQNFINAGKTKIEGINGGKIQVLSKEHKNLQGGKPSYVIIDELSSHIDGKRAAIAEGNLGKKGQNLLEIITTAGDNEMTNPAKQEYDYAKRVLNGDIVNESYLAIIRELDEKDNVHDTKNWQKSQPMFRYCGEYTYSNTLFNMVKSLYEKAYTADNAELQRQFLIFRCNKWQERSVNSFLNRNELQKLNSLIVSKDEFDKLTYNRPKIVGLDYSLRVDLTAYGDVFLLEDGRIAVDAHGFLLDYLADEKEKTDKIPYRVWAKQGYCSIIDYDVMKARPIAEKIIQDAENKEQKIVELCYDPYKCKDMIMSLIDGEFGGHFTEDNCLQINQDPSNLYLPTKRLKEAIIEGTLVWNGNPLLKWCFENAFVHNFTTGKIIDGIKIKKENKDSNRRIDLVAAIITALYRVDNLKKSLKDDFIDSLYSGNFSF